MDKVRFGRALGYGARHAAKTVMKAAEAAAAPGPRATAQSAPGRAAERAERTTPREREKVRAIGPESGLPSASVQPVLRQTPAQARRTGAAVGRAAGSITAPLRRVSSVVFLQVMGSFFALLAFLFGSGAWRAAGVWHGGVHPPAARGDAVRLGLMLAMTVLFAYFSVANFVRASRRERQG